MKFELVELVELSGPFAKIYTVYLYDEEIYLYDQFVEDYKSDFQKEVNSITSRLKIMGKKVGALENYFRQYEGNYGDKVCALLKDEGFKLRMYCIRFDNTCVILGSGGYKDTDTWQEDEILSQEATTMIEISQILHNSIHNADILISSDGEILGELIFDTD